MEEFNNEKKEFYELFFTNNENIDFSSKIDSISLIKDINPKESPQNDNEIKFITSKQLTPANNILQKKTILKSKESSYKNDNNKNGRWTKEEQKKFAEAVLKFGNNWKKIENYINSRNITQIRSHAQKYLIKLKQNEIFQKKGLKQNLSWTKIMNLLKNVLSYDELKDILFSIDEFESPKLKKIKKLKKMEKNKNEIKILKTNEEENNEINEKDQEDEEKKLKKFIECFNCSYGEITLNSSFEENSEKYEGDDFGFKSLNEIKYKYSNNILKIH